MSSQRPSLFSHLQAASATDNSVLNPHGADTDALSGRNSTDTRAGPSLLYKGGVDGSRTSAASTGMGNLSSRVFSRSNSREKGKGKGKSRFSNLKPFQF